jgi:hypothetical protein
VDRIILHAAAPSTIVLRVHWSRYWHGDQGVCIARRSDGFMDVTVPRAGLVTLKASPTSPVARSQGC